MTEVADPAQYGTKRNAASSGPKAGRPQLTQPTFDWLAQKKYNGLQNFEMEVRNIFVTKIYDITDSEKVPKIKNWIGREGPHFIETLTTEKQEMCKNSTDLFQILNIKFKPQHNEIILSLHYCILLSDINESAEEWMDQLRIKVNKCKCLDYDR